MKQFLENEDFKAILSEAIAIKKSKKRFSDIEDGQGHQYVDLVQEGGGVLGIALVGYTYVMEKAGIRFFSLAGTSAGAINTMMLAGLGPIEQAKSEKLLEILSNKELFDIVDGDRGVRALIQRAVQGKPRLFLTLMIHVRNIYQTLVGTLGLNPGNNFKEWISGELKKEGVSTMAHIKALRSLLPGGLRNVNGKSTAAMLPSLAIIAADVTTHSKIEFPRMSELFFTNPQEVSPALLVRASMSIPFFFEPVVFPNIPNAGKIKDERWINHCRYYGPVPPEVRFVDGGLLSNFPINVFHRTDGKPPQMPTFGVRLSTYRESYSKPKGILQFCGSMISSMRQIHDYDFLKRNPDYSKLICHIDADKEFNWLDFEISKEEQVKMFLLGARQAVKFLKGFDWEDYKGIREKLSAKNPMADPLLS